MTETIILTGAINPSSHVQRNDPVVRLTDYLCAIGRWLNVPALEQVIYCDASGCVIPECIFSSDKFESLTFDASDHARKYGAGRAEMESLAFVLERTRFSFESFFKCTGRNFVENFDLIRQEILNAGKSGFCLRPCDVPGWADTRLFWITVEKFRTLIEPRIEELTGQANHGHVVESLFFEYLNQTKVFSEMQLVGHSGHLGYMYQADFRLEEQETARRIIDEFGIREIIP